MSFLNESSQIIPSSPELPLPVHVQGMQPAATGEEEQTMSPTSFEPSVGISPALLAGGSPLRNSPHPSAPDHASGGLVHDAMGGSSAWWTPIPATREVKTIVQTPKKRRPKRSANKVKPLPEKDDDPPSVEMVPMSSRTRLRKVDAKGKLVWPFELEAVLIAGLRKYHATTYRPRPSVSRNLNRNKLVSEYIENMTGVTRTTKQIASRIQVLRESWKGKKEFALVAQPRELAQMGYLPPIDHQEPEMDPNLEDDATSGLRRTRSSRKNANQSIDNACDNDDLEHGAPSSPEDARVASQSSKSNDGVPFAYLDPYQLETLGPPQTSLENAIPSSTLFFIRSTLQGDQGLSTILAKCTVSTGEGPKTGNTPSGARIIVEIDPASIRDRIAVFGESQAQQEKLGSKVHLLQSSVVWDDNEAILGRDAGLVERINARQSEDHPSHLRYALELQLAALQALNSGQRLVIVVQNLSLLRASDSRMLDSWMIIWVVESSSWKTQLELIRLSHMQGARQRALLRPETSPASNTYTSPEGSPSRVAQDIPAPMVIQMSNRSSSSHSPEFEDPAPLPSSPVDSPTDEPMEMTHSMSFALTPPLSTSPAIVDEETSCVLMTDKDDPNVDSHMADNFPESHIRGRIPQKQLLSYLESQHLPAGPSMEEYSAASALRSYTPIVEPPLFSRPASTDIADQHHASRSIPASQPLPSGRAGPIVRTDSLPPLGAYQPFHSHHQQMSQNPHLLADGWTQVHDHTDGYAPTPTYHPIYFQSSEHSLHHGPPYMYLEEARTSVSPPVSAASTSSLAHYHINTHDHSVAEREVPPTASLTSLPLLPLSETPSWNTGFYADDRSSRPAPPVSPGTQIPFRSSRHTYLQEPFVADEVAVPGTYLGDNDLAHYHHVPHYSTRPHGSQPAGYQYRPSQAYTTHPREPSAYDGHRY